MRRFLCPALIALVLPACTNVPYDVPDPGPVTAVEEPSDGRYTVTYRGAPSSSPSRVRDLALLRAATITLQKGGDWFEVVTDYSRQQTERQSRFEQDPFGERQDVRSECGVLGCPSNARPDVGQRDVDPASTQRSFVVQSFEIIVHEGELPLNAAEDSYDALALSNQLRQRYSTSEE